MTRNVTVVTGGAGFIGSHLVHALLEQGEVVRVIDDLSTGSPSSLIAVRADVEFVEASILDGASLRRALRGASVVFHQAAIPSVSRSVENPVRSNDANVGGTLAVLEACRENGVERLVYASSSSVYGGIDALPVRESLPTIPVSPYGVSKLAGELYCRAYTATFGLPTISLRYFNVFGPRQDPSSDYAAVIPRFALALLSRMRPVIQGDGTQSRDFTYIDNVVSANLLATRAPEAAFGRAFNVAHGERHTLLELLSLLRGLIGLGEGDVEWAPPRAGDVRHSQADIGAAREVLGYEPSVAFEEGLDRTLGWVGSMRRTESA